MGLGPMVKGRKRVDDCSVSVARVDGQLCVALHIDDLHLVMQAGHARAMADALYLAAGKLLEMEADERGR